MRYDRWYPNVSNLGDGTLLGTNAAGSVLAARAQPSGSHDALPARLTFEAPRPNPFFGQTRLRLGLPQATMVEVDVFDLAGRRIAMVARERLAAGWHDIVWNGQSRSGSRVAAGIYVCRLVAGEHKADRKLVVMP